MRKPLETVMKRTIRRYPKRRFWTVGRTFPPLEALFKGLSTLFGQRIVEKCFPGKRIRSGLFGLPKSSFGLVHKMPGSFICCHLMFLLYVPQTILDGRKTISDYVFEAFYAPQTSRRQRVPFFSTISISNISIPPKRRFWKEQQKMQCGFSNHLSGA